MAIIRGFINAILSGKLDGTVYANNKAGNYVRAYRKGTDPATTAQLANRADFTAASTSWHALTDAQKAAWNTFAVTIFKPKTGDPGVRYSGFNAFVSLNNVVNNMSSKWVDQAIILPTGITSTPTNFVSTQDAPTFPLSSMIQTAGHLPLQLILNSVDLTASSGACLVKFDLIGPTGPGPITSAPLFEDSIGSQPVGIAIVGSLPITQNQQFVSNPDINLIAIIKPPSTLTGWTTGAQITFDCDPILGYADRKLSYVTDDLIQFKAYLISDHGMTQPLNAVKNNAL